MVEANPPSNGNIVAYINGEGGNTDEYQENMNELGLLKDSDESRMFNFIGDSAGILDDML